MLKIISREQVWSKSKQLLSKLPEENSWYVDDKHFVVWPLRILKTLLYIVPLSLSLSQKALETADVSLCNY